MDPQNMVKSASINQPKDSGRKLFYGLFIFPLIIAVGMAVLLCTVVLLTREAETPESLIAAIKSGSPSKRWQKAFELSNELNQGRGLEVKLRRQDRQGLASVLEPRGSSMIRGGGVMKEIAHILRERKEYDERTRSYMALALARFREPEAGRILQEVLKDEESRDVQLHLIWALGLQKNEDAAPQVRPFLKNEDEDLRKTSAYVLGTLGDKASAGELEKLLNDASRDVRWNAAAALARLGNAAGYHELLKMLDRSSLASYHHMSEDKVEEIMANAVKAVALLKKSEALPVLQRLAESDPSMKVREAALKAIEYQNS